MTKRDRETRILDAALKLILRYGYDKTTIAEIAEEAGISKGAIYLHHVSKEDLFEALWWREVIRSMDFTIELLEDDSEPWTFVRMYQIGLRGIANNLLMQAVMRNDERVLGRFLQKRGASMVAYKRPFQAELLTMMQQMGAIRQDVDVEAATYLLNILAYGFLEAPEHIPESDRPPMETTITTMSIMLQRYLVPKGDEHHEEAKQLVLKMTRQFRDQLAVMLLVED